MEEKGRVNAFANDGSFMEMFKRKMEQEKLRCGSAEEGSRNRPSATGEERDGKSRTLKSSAENARTNDPAGRETGQTETSTVTESRDDVVHRLSAQSVENEGAKESNEEQAVTVPDEQSTREGDKPAVASAPAQKKYSLLSHVGKRRDGKVSLKTGAVKKQRNTEAQESKDQDAWSKYMAEVQKYKAHVCGDEDKSRPLVK
ncbi:telomerase RNA component interacting RNase-like [Patiria miniata]|uniref:Telomerase RNA component interacting RNase n=1 Tax=Patiria miniata TaxID=46514 RepID=A0A913ZBV6_PATMI|nr:telomerase RNA component interacting RNase-like [Patiria miniata]